MNTIQVGKLTISPSLERTVKEIHPAIGVVDDIAYVGVWLPCEIEDDKGTKMFKDLLFLVTDKRKLLLANDEVFHGKGLDWKLGHKPIKFTNRWSLQDVQAYLNGKIVDPSKVFQKIVDVWKKYMELPDTKEYLYHALWDIGTYFHHLFNCYPYIYLGGIKRSGKSKGLTLHLCLSFNAILSNNMSTATIYRLVQNARSTLLIDESEKLAYRGMMSERTREFRSILLSGYKRGSKTYRIEKTKKDEFHPKPFETYSPKALANIQGLEDVIEDRCKSSILKRSINHKIINLEVDELSEYWSELRSELYILFLENWMEIQHIHDKIGGLDELSELVNVKNIPHIELLVGRELELWKGIIALSIFFDRKGVPSELSEVVNVKKTLQNEKEGSISKFISSPSSLTTLILKLATQDAKQRQTENITETGEIILTQILLDVVREDNYYPVKTLKEKMLEAFDEEQKWITTRWIGNALRRLGFKEKRRVGTGYQYKLNKSDVEDLAARLGLETEPKDHTPIDEMLKPTTCFLCHKILPEDLAYCTYLDGKPVHCSCAAKIEAQEKKEWKCPQLATLEGNPYCRMIQSILAKPEDCKPDCSLLKEKS